MAIYEKSKKRGTPESVELDPSRKKKKQMKSCQKLEQRSNKSDDKRRIEDYGKGKNK